MGYVSKAAAVTPPVVGANTWRLDAADVTPTTFVTVPDAWKDSIMRFEAEGEDMYFALGDASLAGVVPANKSTIAANVITVQGDVCWHLEQNTFVDIDLSLVDETLKARLAVLGASGVANNGLRITRTSGYVRG